MNSHLIPTDIDPMTSALCATCLAWEESDDRWDVDPALMLIMRRDIQADGTAVIEGAVYDMPTLPGQSPADSLEFISARGRMPFLDDDPTQDVVGLALRHEGWMVHASPEDTEMLDAAARHELHAHPGRIEVRSVMAVDTAGMTYLVNRIRGEEPTMVVYSPAEGENLSGRVVDSLRILLTGSPTP